MYGPGFPSGPETEIPYHQKPLNHTHYTLSVAIEVVQLFVPPRGSRQLCARLATRCGLAQRMYHYVWVAKNIPLYSLYWGQRRSQRRFLYFTVLHILLMRSQLQNITNQFLCLICLGPVTCLNTPR